MEFEKLCEKFYEEVGKKKTVRITVEESEINIKTINVYSDIKEEHIPATPKENRHIEIVKALLIPTTNYLAKLLELNQNNGNEVQINRIERLFKSSFKFPF